MPIMRVHVAGCLQNSHELGSTDEHMVSRFFLKLEVDGKPVGEAHVDVKQVVGSKYRDNEPLEVGPPTGYRGPFNDRAFRQHISDIYRRRVVGPVSGGAIVSSTGEGTIIMRDNRFGLNETFDIEIGPQPAGW